MQLESGSVSFDNLLVFVTDALRYDAVPDSLERRGTVVKTVASGLSTPESFSSMITGRYPPQHGVYRFSHQLDADLPTLFDLQEHNRFVTDPDAGIVETLNLGDLGSDPLADIGEPFCYLVRDLSAHTPYSTGFDSSAEYWNDRGGDIERVTREYHDSVERSVRRFEECLDVLDQRGIRENTLVVYTSDHGELLGEYGLGAHGSPTCPELVYVPTMFLNDGVEPGPGYMAHVDLLPTVMSLLGRSAPATDDLPGYDLTTGAPPDRPVFNQVKRLHFRESSVWDGEGGHVFQEDGVVDRLRWFSRHMRDRTTAPYNRRHPLSVLRTFLRGDRTEGTPGISRETAAEYRDAVLEGAVASGTRELSEDVVERLEQLGYREEI